MAEEKRSLKKIFTYDWDAIAGIVAAFVALVMHFLHIFEAEIMISVAVVLIALLFIRDLRHEGQTERIDEGLRETSEALKLMSSQMTPPEVLLIGPGKLRQVTREFSQRARGEMVFFHICPLMFRRQELFDELLKPAIQNPQVTSIHFITDKRQQKLWEAELQPKIEKCSDKDKVATPCWTEISDNVSVIISSMGEEGKAECLLSFWGEPFMSQNIGSQVPRYIFHVLPQSELLSRLVELVRHHRITN